MIDIDEKHKVGTLSRTTCIPDNFYGSHRSFLICMDGSENSEYAFHWTISNLVQDGDHIMLLRILPELDLTDIYVLGYDFVDEIQQSAESVVNYQD